MSAGEPVATKISETRNAVRWLVKWPSTMTVQGKAYIVSTYPGTDLIFIESAASRRVVAQGVATKITPEIRAAIARAREAAEK